MRIGVPREVSPGESRVALAPHAVHELARAGHRVLVEAGAGEASSIPDERYEEAGARTRQGGGPRLRRLRARRQGLRTYTRGVPLPQGRLDPLRLPLAAGERRAHAGAPRLPVRRLRDGGHPRPQGGSAGPRSDERDRRPHHASDRGSLPAAPLGRAGHTARRLDRGEAGAGGDPWLRHRRVGRCQDVERPRSARRRDRPRPRPSQASRGGLSEGRHDSGREQHGDKECSPQRSTSS